MKKLVEKYKLPMRAQYYEGKHILALSQEEKIHLEDYSEYYIQKKEKLMPMIEKLNKLSDQFYELQ